MRHPSVCRRSFDQKVYTPRYQKWRHRHIQHPMTPERKFARLGAWFFASTVMLQSSERASTSARHQCSAAKNRPPKASRPMLDQRRQKPAPLGLRRGHHASKVGGLTARGFHHGIVIGLYPVCQGTAQVHQWVAQGCHFPVKHPNHLGGAGRV